MTVRTITSLLRDNVALITNGYQKVGFTHLADVGLPPEHYLVTPVVLEDVPSLADDMGDEATKQTTAALYVRTVVANEEGYSAYVQAKRVNAQIARAFRPLALSVRGAAVALGTVSHEHRVVEVNDENEVSDAAADACTTPIAHGALFCAVRAINFINTNHCTTGSTLPESQLRVAANLVGYTADLSREDKIAITDVMYWAMHPVDWTAWADLLLKMEVDVKGKAAADSSGVPDAGMDDWLTLRARPLPAGTHALAVLYQCLLVIASYGALVIFPDQIAVKSLPRDLALIREDPFSYHPAAAWLGKEKKSIDVARYKKALVHAAHFVKGVDPHHSVLKSPSIVAALKGTPDRAFVGLANAIASDGAPDINSDLLVLVKESAGTLTTEVDWTDKNSVENRGAELREALVRCGALV